MAKSRQSRYGLTRFLCAVAVAIGAFSYIACKKIPGKSDLLTNQTNPNKTAVDVNDLSYMFVRNAKRQIYPRIPVAKSWNQVRTSFQLPPIDPTGGLADKPILTKKLLDSIRSATEDQKNFGKKVLVSPFVGIDASFRREQFVITAFRIDPCAPSLALDKNRTNHQTPIAQSTIEGIVGQINQEIERIFQKNKFTLNACQTQLRLILQPASPKGDNIYESTIHMVFTLNNSDGIMSDVMQADVQGLKQALKQATGIDTTGYLLQPHPGLKAEAAKNSDISKPGPGAQVVVAYLSRILRHYANPQVVAVIRETYVGDQRLTAVLGGGVSDPRRDALYSPGPLVSANSRRGFAIVSGNPRSPKSWVMDPMPTRNDPVFNDLLTFDARDIESPEDTILLKMMRMDDPESTHFFINDCVTCHGTSQALHEVSDTHLLAKVRTRFKVPAGVSGFPVGRYLPPPPSKSGGIMLRNFGYSRNKPIIGLRTVTETAQLVDYFNRDLRGVNNPGANCAGEAEAKAWAGAMQSNEYKFHHPNYDGKAAFEDRFFKDAGCQTAVTDVRAIGQRGGKFGNPKKIGEVISPLFNQMSFAGKDSGGSDVTLVLAKDGQASLAALSQGSRTPKLFIGEWTYVTDSQRVTQIRVSMNGKSTLYGMRGIQLCPVAGSSNCLSLQTDWAGSGVPKASAGSGKSVRRTLDCPENFIEVPGDDYYRTRNFCVMKYEAKPSGTIKVESVPHGLPLKEVSQQAASTYCQNSGYRLVSNYQWMSIAVNIASQPENWSRGKVGQGMLNLGNTYHSGPLAASDSDSSPCHGLSTAQDCDRGRRTHVLENGEVIWDFSGNVGEWVRYTLKTGKISREGIRGAGKLRDHFEISDIVKSTFAMVITDLRPTSKSHAFWIDSWNSRQGMGQYAPGHHTSLGGAMARGGYYNSRTEINGIFHASMNYESQNTDSRIGFRCVKTHVPRR